MTRIVAIVGTRRLRETWMRQAIMALVRDLPADAIVVSGGALGVDTFAAERARERGLAVETFPPDYGRFSGAEAPKERNTIIADRCTELHAFPGPESRGTWDVVNKAKALGRTVVVHGEEKPCER